jgi:hypothetical protein
VEVASDKGVPQVVARWGREPTSCTSFGPEGFALARKNGRVSLQSELNSVLAKERFENGPISELIFSRIIILEGLGFRV